MEDILRRKIKLIQDIWNNYIWEYQVCRKGFKNEAVLKKNYFAEIISYLNDTLELFSHNHKSSNFFQRVYNSTALLQIIYVQQDVVKELLQLFNCEEKFQSLEGNTDFTLNRNIRNSLVGHPINRGENNTLVSSALFSFGRNKEFIDYALYKYDDPKSANFERKSENIDEIIKRHERFMNTFLDEILKKLKNNLDRFKKELLNIENLLDQPRDLKKLVEVSSLKFEQIHKSDYCYDESSLLKIIDKIDEHPRYKYFIEQFSRDLKDSIVETKTSIEAVFEEKEEEEIDESKNVKVEFVIPSANSGIGERKVEISYRHELQKLAEKGAGLGFEFVAESLTNIFPNSKVVSEELTNMRKNLNKDFEYYSSYKFLDWELSKTNLLH